MLVSTTWFGTFLLDPESGSIIKKKLFPNSVPKIVERLNAIQNQNILSEEKSLIKGVKEPLAVTEERLRALGEVVESVSPLPDNINLIPEDFGFKSEQHHEVLLELGKLRTREAVAEDFFIVQAIKGLDDLTQIANLLSERLHEWYGLHWPELEKLVKETEYVSLISNMGDMATILEKSNNEKLKSITLADSVGSGLETEDRGAVMGYAEQLDSVYSSRIKLENYIKSRMEAVAPNITAITGPIIGARLISLTGSLARLAQVSSSTIQLLGAEKALFRHLRDGEKPPKHGIIFQNPFIHNAPYWQRGKIARALAGKLSIAAKLDYNSDKFMGDEITKDLKRRINEIKKKYPNAPPKKPKKGWKKARKDKKTRRGKRGKGRKRGR